ncbi:hypothetical protein V6N12_018218 [Hibiscus sabdariffa]|uniref:Uncharacterized protein n=1 Tax=Hibiscus sabdariffa TaxID=183260 RepID=A0ABR2BPQ0_9ROSI
MAAKTGGFSFVQPLHPPCPKSPPSYPDLYGKRREKDKVQMLEREISFLEVSNPLRDTAKSMQSLITLKNILLKSSVLAGMPNNVFYTHYLFILRVTDFVMANSDPFIPPKNRKSCGFWKWLCGLPCCNMACFCCCCNSGCSCYLKCPECCDGDLSAAELRNGGVALVLSLDIAMERSRADGIVAVSGFLRAQTAVLADGDALVLNVQRYAIAAVVQKPVVTHAAKML